MGLVGAGADLIQIDLLKAGLQELQSPTERHNCSMKIARDGPVAGFCGYFDVFFRGSPTCSAQQEVTLSTAPATTLSTHWGQQVFSFNPPFESAKRGDTLKCTMLLTRQARNHRLLQMDARFTLHGPEGTLKSERHEQYFLD